MQDELLDIVDDNDIVIGKEKRSVIYENGWRNFRVVNGFLINSRGELWIPKRTPTKRIFPDALDMSIGGHVESGETYLQAFKRELQEELNLNLDILQYFEIGYLTPRQNDVSAFMKLYVIQTDITPHYNPEDFSSASWYSVADLFSLLNKPTKAKSDLIKLVNYYNTYINS